MYSFWICCLACLDPHQRRLYHGHVRSHHQAEPRRKRGTAIMSMPCPYHANTMPYHAITTKQSLTANGVQLGCQHHAPIMLTPFHLYCVPQVIRLALSYDVNGYANYMLKSTGQALSTSNGAVGWKAIPSSTDAIVKYLRTRLVCLYHTIPV